MPELPEVETVVRDLRPLLAGRRVASVTAGPMSLREAWRPEWSARMAGRTLQALRRRGKWILADLDESDTLIVHLGMTGQLTVTTPETHRPTHLHLVFALEGEPPAELRFRDVRRFGSARLVPTSELSDFLADRLGPEPWDLQPGDFHAALAATSRPVKAALLDQTIVAGVGNIYADESLFRARIHPATLGRDVTPAEADRLRDAIAAVLDHAIDKRGSTIRDYIGGSGLKGGFQDEFRVYGRAGKPCTDCRTPLSRVRLAGRSTHFCSQCQRKQS